MDDMKAITDDRWRSQRLAVLEAVHKLTGEPNEANSHRHSLVVLPKGAGKSGVAVYTSYALRAHKVLVLTPSKARSKHIKAAFVDDPFLAKCGIWASMNREHFNRVHACCIYYVSIECIVL